MKRVGKAEKQYESVLLGFGDSKDKQLSFLLDNDNVSACFLTEPIQKVSVGKGASFFLTKRGMWELNTPKAQPISAQA